MATKHQHIQTAARMAAAAVMLSAIVPAAAVAQETQTVLVLDGSNSMWGQIDGTAKIETAKIVLSDLVGDLSGSTRLGIVAYGHRSKTDCNDIEVLSAIGADGTDAIRTKINGISPLGKTPIAAAIAAAGAMLADTDGARSIVLVSDGIETCNGDPCAVSATLAGQNINTRVHVVGFDVGKEERTQLECIAEQGNGKYYDAANAGELEIALAEVKKETAAAPKPEPKSKVIFEDDFASSELNGAWAVTNPNPDAFILEDGKLLIVASKAGGFDGDDTPNFFSLDVKPPNGDWVLSATVQAEYQTQKESVWLGVRKDAKNWVAARLYTSGDRNYGHALNLQVEKASNGDITKFTKAVRSLGCNVCGPDRQFANFAQTITSPMTLSLVREGRKFSARLTIEGDVDKEDKAIVHETDSVSSLRLPGGIVATVAQNGKTGGETLFFIDRVELTAPDEN